LENDQVLKADTSNEDKTLANDALKIMAVLATYTMDNFSSSEPKGLSSSVETLNRALKSISCTKTGEQIYEMSIKYWKIHPQLEMTLSVNVIHWLLIQTLNSKAAVSYFSILILDYIIIV